MKKICVVSHDAGGAEVVSNWVKQNYEGFKFSFALDGPALNIFSKNLNTKIKKMENIAKQIKKSDIILCGTSWQSELEKNAIKMGKMFNTESIAILDHWVYYKERFIDKNFELQTPDQIWVCDKEAFKIAKSIFKKVKIVQIQNPYIYSIKKELEKLSSNIANKNPNSILYVCEPTKAQAKLHYGDENAHGFTEETALTYFLRNINKVQSDKEEIIIRPHPSEEMRKYQWVYDFKLPNLVVRKKESLLEEIICSKLVVGCESMAMVIALEVGKRVLCSIPPEGRRCSLPHDAIQSLDSIM